MRNKYFTFITGSDVQFGVINNIPEEITDQMVAERINATDENTTIELTDDEFDTHCIDIELDWQLLDKSETDIALESAGFIIIEKYTSEE